jgi:competence protein ComEC
MNGPAIPGQGLPARFAQGLERSPLFFAAMLFAGGALAAHFAWIRPAVLLVALLASATVCCVAGVRALRLATLPLTLFWILLGAWCAEMEPQPAPDAQLLSLSDGLLRTVEGTVTDAAPLRQEMEEESGRPPVRVTTQRVDVQLGSIETVDDLQDQLISASGKVRLTLRWKGLDAARLRCGDRIRADVRLLPPQVYHDPGAWNRRDFLLQSGITATASVPAQRVESTPAARRSLACSLSNAQHAASERLMLLPALTQRMPATFRVSRDDAAMLAAMVSGDRTFLDHSLRVGFERTGSFHMLVVSGFHLAIVAGVIFWLARRMRLPQIPATVLTIAMSFGFALFTGFGTPVRRSLFMVAIYLIGRLFFRDRSMLNVIGFATLCLLAMSPHALFEASFQMTLLAVLTIGGLASPLLRASLQPYIAATRDLRQIVLDAKLAPAVAQFRILLRMFTERIAEIGLGRRAWKFVPAFVRITTRVCEAIIVSLIIELAMTLPMAIYFHRITALALPVNVLILPVLLVLLPAAIVTLLVLVVWPAAAAIPAIFTACCLHVAVLWIHLFGSMRFGDMRLPTPHAWQVIAFWSGLGVAILLAHSGARAGRRAAWLVLLAAALLPIIPNPIQHPRDALLVEALDVGQGDSILLITPEGKTLLVDAGGFVNVTRPAEQEFDIGEEVVSAALWERGIRHLDVVAISHAHLDHMGGIPAVLRNFHPDELWVGDNPPSAAYQDVLDEAQRSHTSLRSFRAGTRLTLGSVVVDVLAPFPDYEPGKAASNNDSLVLRAEYAGASMQLQGDAEAAVERRLAESGPLAASLLKVGHHGSTTSTQPEFLHAIAPRWAVISCGLHNRFGHPRAEVLDELQAAGVRTFVTDIDGASCFRLDAGGARPLSCTDQ